MYHLTARGNNRQEIYVDDTDRRFFLSLLERSAVRYGWRCWAYCLMTNHFHLVVKTPRGVLSEGMQELNGGYARTFNRRHGREGHLFRNRFWAEQVASDSHLLESLRYVVLNPVRAGICALPEHWPWSSYRSSAGLETPPAFLFQGEVLELFGLAEARGRYRQFVTAGQLHRV